MRPTHRRARGQRGAAVRKQVQRVYSYICVDEFQDTNRSQYDILASLVNAETKNLFVVADDDQIIYQWNGANPERLEALKNDFSMTVLQLPANYRCPPKVIELANRLIVHNAGRSSGKQPLQAKKPPNGEQTVRLMRFASFDKEREWVAQDIAQRDAKERGRCVVLARTRKLLEQTAEALEVAGVPDEFVSAPMRWLHAILRLANAPQDREQLRRACNAFYALEGIQLDAKDVASSAATVEGSFLRAFAQVALAREEIATITRKLLEHAIPKLADTLDFRAFTTHAFAWLDGMQENAPEIGEDFTEYADEKAT
jgi:DNA helicase II / ATP-dependent DNA helicase PcrA